MDANGQRFRMLSERSHWLLSERSARLFVFTEHHNNRTVSVTTGSTILIRLLGGVAAWEPIPLAEDSPMEFRRQSARPVLSAGEGFDTVYEFEYAVTRGGRGVVSLRTEPENPAPLPSRFQLTLETPRPLAYDSSCRTLHLPNVRSRGEPDGSSQSASAAISSLERVPQTMDAYMTRAFWDTASRSVLATGAFPDTTPILTLAEGQTPTDLAMGYDGVLYLAVDGDVALHDRRERWEPVTLRTENFSAWRLAADPGGGAWVLDRSNRRLARVDGLPLPDRPIPSYTPETARPCEEDSDPPRLNLFPETPWRPNEVPIALAANRSGELALLTTGAGPNASVRLLREGGTLADPVTLHGCRFPYSLTWVSQDRIALLAGGLDEALVYHWNPGSADVLRPEGDYYPLPGHGDDPFVNGVSLPPHFPTDSGTAPLHRLSLPTYAGLGFATNEAPIDGGKPQHEWHRLYIEASIPRRTGIVIWLAATDEAQAPAETEREAWNAHLFGDAAPVDLGPGVPRGAWVPAPSEIPHHAGLLGRSPVRNVTGLFTVLVQRAQRQVRTLRGRYLWLRIELTGDSRTTPEVAAIRVYGSRFSYRDKYLPELYHETVFGEDAELPGAFLFSLESSFRAEFDHFAGTVSSALESVFRANGLSFSRDTTHTPIHAGSLWQLKDPVRGSQYLIRGQDSSSSLEVFSAASTRPDFLERYLGNFEGVLTAMEDTVADAHVAMHPRSASEEALEWLGSWIGVAFDSAYPVPQRRELLAAAPLLFRRRGTLKGLKLALELATGGKLNRDRKSVRGGGVTGGEIVVVEDYRLRRTFATILGADFENERDPLLPGLSVSGNSLVGDTLFLGEEHRKEFLAIFGSDLVLRPREAKAVAAFFDELAFRVTVLVHQNVTPQDLGLVRRVVELESPAHILARVVPATHPFLAGIASLVGVDSYLNEPPAPEAATVNASTIGDGDFIVAPASLDPRLEGVRGGLATTAPVLERPSAVLTGPARVPFGDSFNLDGGGSRAAEGRRIERYFWTMRL